MVIDLNYRAAYNAVEKALDSDCTDEVRRATYAEFVKFDVSALRSDYADQFLDRLELLEMMITR